LDLFCLILLYHLHRDQARSPFLQPFFYGLPNLINLFSGFLYFDPTKEVSWPEKTVSFILNYKKQLRQ